VSWTITGLCQWYIGIIPYLNICLIQTFHLSLSNKSWTYFQFHLNVWWNVGRVVEAYRGNKDLAATSLHLLVVNTHYNSFHILYSCFAILSVLDWRLWLREHVSVSHHLLVLVVVLPCFPFAFVFLHCTSSPTNVLKQMLNNFGSLLAVPCRQWSS
jgi:hypothetical protein